MGPEDSTRLTLLLRLRDRADSLSWREFHDRYGQLLYRYARARGAGHADAEDVVQEVELALFKAMERFEYDAQRGRFRAYLRAAVIHTLSRRADRQNRQPPALDPNDLDYVSAESEASADARWEMEWQQNRLRWAMRIVAAEFEGPTIRAFEQHVLAGRGVDEVAAELGMSASSVYQAKSRILKRLREHLSQVDPEGDL
jgi:RNA polymerase sigma-70 factor (ECF subfamily)